MRRYIGPLIALGVFVVLLVVVLTTQNGSNSTVTPTANLNVTPTVSQAEKDLQILNLGANTTINQLDIKTITGTVTLKLDNNNWKQTAPSQLDLDSSVISDTVRQFNTLKGSTFIPPDKAGDLKAFGLDNPSLTVTLNTAGSGTKTLNFGAVNPATSNIYVKLADDPRVWAINQFYSNTLSGWVTKPPTPAPTVAPAGNPLTPLPSVTPSPTAGATTAAVATTPPVTTTTAAATTTAPPTTTS